MSEDHEKGGLPLLRVVVYPGSVLRLGRSLGRGLMEAVLEQIPLHFLQEKAGDRYRAALDTLREHQLHRQTRAVIRGQDEPAPPVELEQPVAEDESPVEEPEQPAPMSIDTVPEADVVPDAVQVSLPLPDPDHAPESGAERITALRGNLSRRAAALSLAGSLFDAGVSRIVMELSGELQPYAVGGHAKLADISPLVEKINDTRRAIRICPIEAILAVWRPMADERRRTYAGHRLRASKEGEPESPRRGPVYLSEVDEIERFVTLLPLVSSKAWGPLGSEHFEEGAKEWLLHSTILLNVGRKFWPELNEVFYPCLFPDLRSLAAMVKRRFVFDPVPSPAVDLLQRPDPFGPSPTFNSYGDVGAEAIRVAFRCNTALEPGTASLLQDWFWIELGAEELGLDPKLWKAKRNKVRDLFGEPPHPPSTARHLLGRKKGPGRFAALYAEASPLLGEVEEEEAELDEELSTESGGSTSSAGSGGALSSLPRNLQVRLRITPISSGKCQELSARMKKRHQLNMMSSETWFTSEGDLRTLLEEAHELLIPGFWDGVSSSSLRPKRASPLLVSLELAEQLTTYLTQVRAQVLAFLPWIPPYSWKRNPGHREFLFRCLYHCIRRYQMRLPA